MEKAKVVELLVNDGSDVTGSAVEMPPWRDSGRGMAVASIDGTGSIASSVTIQGSPDGTHWVTIGSAIALSASATDSKVQAIDYPWAFMRAVAASGSGTRAKLRVVVTL